MGRYCWIVSSYYALMHHEFQERWRYGKWKRWVCTTKWNRYYGFYCIHCQGLRICSCFHPPTSLLPYILTLSYLFIHLLLHFLSFVAISQCFSLFHSLYSRVPYFLFISYFSLFSLFFFSRHLQFPFFVLFFSFSFFLHISCFYFSSIPLSFFSLSSPSLLSSSSPSLLFSHYFFFYNLLPLPLLSLLSVSFIVTSFTFTSSYILSPLLCFP